jgi:hypothetical protein
LRVRVIPPHLGPFHESCKPPPGFGVRQPSGAFEFAQSGRGLPQSKTLARIIGGHPMAIASARRFVLRSGRQGNERQGNGDKGVGRLHERSIG